MSTKRKSIIQDVDVMEHDLTKLVEKVRSKAVKLEEAKEKVERSDHFHDLSRLIAYYDAIFKLLNICKLLLRLG